MLALIPIVGPVAAILAGVLLPTAYINPTIAILLLAAIF